MKRLLNHLLQILVLGGIFFLMMKLPLFKIPHIQEILTGILFLLIVIFVGILVYKRKTLMKVLLMAVLFFVKVAVAQSITGYQDYSAQRSLVRTGAAMRCSSSNFCTMAERYDEDTFNAKNNNWTGDYPCLDSEVTCVRDTLNKLKITPSVFKARDKLTFEQMKTYRSFRQDSHWKEWVDQYFSESAKAAGADPEQLACAAKLASLCSEYERRHPAPTSLTVGAIMRSDAETVGCWPCKMSRIILTVVQDLSSNLESKIQDAALRILSIFFLLWVLYATFLAVVFPSKASNFLKDFMTRLLCVMIAAMILASGDNLKALYKNVITPVISLGLGLSQEINQATSADTTFASEINTRLGIDTLGDDETYCTALSSSSSGGIDLFSRFLPQLSYQKNSSGNTTSGESLLTPQLQVSLLCMTKTMYQEVSPITAVGQSLIGFSLNESAETGVWAWIKKFIGLNVLNTNFKMWFVGFTLVVLFSVFGFLVAFKIIDIFLRLGFVLVLMPLFVATWAFPSTREFTKKGLMFLMSIVTEFLGLALAINFIIVLFETGVVSNRTELINKMVAGYSKEYGDNLLNAILTNGGWYFFFMMIALAFMGFQLLSVCTKIISSFFGTEAVGGDIMGATAVSAIQTAGKLAKKTWDVGSKAAENAKSYHTPTDKSMSYVAGRAYGRLKSGQNPLKDVSNPFRDVMAKSATASPKRYFGQKAGDGVNKVSQGLAKGLDRIGVTAGQALQRTGIGAIVGVPLTLATKTLTTGIRAAGKVTSTVIKTPGAVVYGTKKAPQVVKNASKVLWNKVSSGPKKLLAEVKRGFDRGEGK